jgi:purine-binding chemotaxis protein CheW
MNSYLTFEVVDEVFAIHVSNVMEIREHEKPRPVPQKVEFIEGLIEFRDEVIPLINTGVKFNLGTVEATGNSVIIVINLQKPGEADSFRVAIMAESVSDVLEIEDSQLNPFIRIINRNLSPEPTVKAIPLF